MGLWWMGLWRLAYRRMELRMGLPEGGVLGLSQAQLRLLRPVGLRGIRLVLVGDVPARK